MTRIHRSIFCFVFAFQHVNAWRLLLNGLHFSLHSRIHFLEMVMHNGKESYWCKMAIECQMRIPRE